MRWRLMLRPDLILDLDPAVGESGAHSAFVDPHGSAIEQVSNYVRAGNDLKFRTTLSMGENQECQDAVLAAVRSMHLT
jgi:hypothetical protein